MSKRAKRRSRASKSSRGTNWVLIGGIIGVGIVLLAILAVFSLQDETIVTLADYCEENPGVCPTKGAADAPVTIVEVMDLGCTHCRTFDVETAPLIEEAYVDAGDVKFISFPYALRSTTIPASNASLCAHDQGLYFEYVDEVFANFAPDGAHMSNDALLAAGEATDGLNMDEFAVCVANGRFNDVVSEGMRLAAEQRVFGTPQFFVNEVRLEGAQPFPVFQQTIEQFLN